MNPSSNRELPRELRTVFLDRDGVLNEKAPEGEYVARWEDLHVLPGVPEALAALKRVGVRLIVVSNQRGIARGLYTAADVDGLHTRFQQMLAPYGAQIDAFFICPHDADQCNCRKPLTGMFEQALARFPDISPGDSAMIGDGLADVEFGRRAGMATILIEGDPARQPLGSSSARALASAHFPSLSAAVEALLALQGSAGSGAES